MNGSRSTVMRKGYLLTALAAAVLLAASPGTAVAQTTGITITGPTNGMVNEGGTATYTVAVRAYVPRADDANGDGTIQPTEAVAASAVVVTLGTIAPGTTDATAGELIDLDANAHVLTARITTPRNASTNARLFTGSAPITLATLHDNDAENEEFTFVFELTAAGGATLADGTTAITLANAPTTLTIDDDETQGYRLTLASGQTPTEGGGAFTVNLTASPAHEDGSGTMNVIIDKDTDNGWDLTIGDTDSANPAIVVAPGEGATPAEDSMVEIGITQDAGDGNRVTDTVTVSAHTGVAGASREVASLSIDVADANALQAVTAKVVNADGMVLDPQPESVEEGKSVKIAVMPVDKDGKVTTANEDLKIALASSGSADARDFRLSAPITITASQESSNVVDLMAETDEDVGMEMLMLDATVSGVPTNGTETKAVAGVLSIEITDATAKKIEPKATDVAYPAITAAIAAGAGDDEKLNPGEMVEIMTDDLFTVAANYTATYSVSVDGDAVSASASGEAVMLTAEMAGESTVYITGTARMAGSSLEASQTVSNVAELKFPVTVVDMPLMITLEMPDNVMEGNIVEGSSYDIGVMANRMITDAEGSVDVTFMQRAGAERAASNADYDIDGVTIMAGEDMATATLMVTEDMTDDAGHADGESLDLYGSYGDDGMTNVLEFTIWDEAVPALPLIGQLVLALMMALGGARLYRRRQG